MTKEVIILLGDLVYYIGPPIVNPPIWSSIIENDNGIISRNDIGIIIDTDGFLRIADVFFQRQKITIKRISHKQLKIVQ